MTTHLYDFRSPSLDLCLIPRFWLDWAIAACMTVYHRAIDHFVTANHPDFRISQFLGNNGELFWAIHDQRTDSTVYCLTETEVMQWLAQRGYR